MDSNTPINWIYEIQGRDPDLREMKNTLETERIHRRTPYGEREPLAIKRNITGLEILASEFKSGLAKLNRIKAKGHEGILLRMLAALDGFGTDIIT